MKRKKKSPHKDFQLLKQQIKEFNHIIIRTHEEVREALDKGPDFGKELEERLEKSLKVIEAIRKKISSAKAHSKKRKREIDQWKDWYNSHTQLDRMVEWNQLNEEISWRATDIAKKEAEISSLYIELVQAEGVSENIKLQIEALARLDFNGKVDDDIRVQTLMKEKRKLERKMEKLKEK